MLLPRRLFHLGSRFTLLFHCGSFSPLCCDPALSMFASKCQGVECHAVKAARCDLGDPGWGESLVSALSLVASHTLQLAHGDFVLVLLLFILWACQHDTQVVICKR